MGSRIWNDIAIAINGKFLSTICELMQKALFSCRPGVGGVGMSLNAG
jgi:hypothetical protein